MIPWIILIAILTGMVAFVVLQIRGHMRIDLDELTSDWEWREAADPQKPFIGGSRDRSLRGKDRRRARRAAR